jgi:hypothetical protein
MNIIKRIGVALDLVVFGNLSTGQAKDLIPLIKSAWPGIPPFSNPEHWQELQRRSEKLAWIEGNGYKLKSTDPKVASPNKSESVNALSTHIQIAPPPRLINRNNRRGSVQDAVLHCINGLPSRYYTSIDVWREYQLLNGPKTTRGTVLACVTHLRESGVIQAANPPRKLGTKIVHQK